MRPAAAAVGNNDLRAMSATHSKFSESAIDTAAVRSYSVANAQQGAGRPTRKEAEVEPAAAAAIVFVIFGVLGYFAQ